MLRSRLVTRLRDERGISMIMALGVTLVLSLTTAGVIQYTAAGSRTSSIDRGRQSAQALAEAGINNALAVLSKPENDPQTATLLDGNPGQGGVQPIVLQLEGGSVSYSGTYVGDPSFLWTITSTGSVPNPTGGPALTRTLTRVAEVKGLNSGASVSAWSRMYHDSTSTCLTIEDVTIPVPIASRGDICLKGSGKITGTGTIVEAGDDVTMTRATTSSTRSPSAATGWTSSSNVYSSNNSRATYSLAVSGQSANLDVTGFGFAIPSTATVVGVYVEVEHRASGSLVDDEDIYLLTAGATSGNDKASSNDWTTSSSDNTEDYGSSTDLWGTTWTPAQVNASNFGLRIRADNDHTSSTRTAEVDHVEITVYYQPVPTASIGVSGTPVAQAHIGDYCTFDGGTAHKPCSAADQVYGTQITSSPQGLSKPAIDLAYWYDHARPGPMHNCTTGSFPGGFDNNTTYDNSRSGSAEVTPTSSSYTCQVHDAYSNLLGELSWDHTTHVLKIKGTVFVDGDFRFDDDGQVVHYQGRGIIYASGDLEYDELVCAGGSGTTSCVTTGMENWDPTQNMMTVLSGGWSEFDQGSTQQQSVPSGLQGIIYSQGECLVHQNFHLSGPIVCDRITLPSDGNGWPTYSTWPALGTLTEGQMYGSPDLPGTDSWAVFPGSQTG